jgi:hypothetical protein
MPLMTCDLTLAFSCRALQYNATSERSEQGALLEGTVKSNALFDSFAMPAADAFARTLGPPTPPPALTSTRWRDDRPVAGL